jgi:sodium-dependent dicarboxylate transporter 2/3/5
MTIAERRVTAVFVVTVAMLWITGPLLRQVPGLAGIQRHDDCTAGGAVPVPDPESRAGGRALLKGADLRRVLGRVLLFGGGLALAEAIQGSGVAAVLGTALAGIGAWPLVSLIATMVALLVMWTEFNSNVATAATFMPILAAIAATSDYPVLQLVVPVALAASCGFMLPVGTPPNAIVFGTGRLTMQEMIGAGWRVNLAAIVIVTAVSLLVIPLIA